ATYVLELASPVPLGTRAVVHLRLSLDDAAAESFAEVAFATAEPFRVVELGCRAAGDSEERHRAYPVTPEGARYTEAQALGCPAGSRTLLLEFSTAPRDIGPVEGRNLVRFTPAVDDLSFSVEEPAPHTEVGPVSLAQLQRHIAALGSPPVSTLVGLPLRRDGKAASFGLDLGPHVARVAGKERPGAYLVGLRRLDSSSERSWMRVQVTDLSLTTLEEPDAVRFAVTSLARGLPVAGASIRVEGTRENEWVTLAEGTTGADGSFRWPAPGWDPGHPIYRQVRRIVVASDGDALVLDPLHAPDGYADNHWSATR